MKISEQFRQAVFIAPASLKLLRRRSMVWLWTYLLCGVAIFSLLSWVLIENQESIKLLLLDYFFPKSWQGISETLGRFLFESQAKIVLGNLIISGSLVVASICLFPVKEQFSAKFELDAAYSNGPEQGFSLALQAFEEAKLLFLYITAQLVILWLGYYPYSWTHGLSIVLSYGFLFFTFGLDFISPTLQRHRHSYTLILKVLGKNLPLVFLFGAIYSLPVIILSQILFAYESLTLIEISSILFLVNILFLTAAVPLGTHIASALMPETKNTIPSKAKSIRRFYAVTGVILLCMLLLHGGLIASLHHKSQLLKAQYTIDWSSLNYKFPPIGQLLSGEKAVLSNLSFDVAINNPTQFDIVIEDSVITVKKSQNIIATMELSGFEIPSESSRLVNVKLDSNTEFAKVGDLSEIFEAWRVDFQFELWPGIPFIVNVID